jgi:hypothetical protein
MLPDIGHLHQVGIEAGLSDALAKGRLVESRTARSHYYSIQPVFEYVLLDLFLPGVGARVPIPHRDDHAGQILRETPHGFRVDSPRDVEAAVADKDPDSQFLFNQ